MDIEETVVGKLKVRVRPQTPAAKEVDEHNATHYPYRSWCRHCVAGSGRRDGHVAVSGASRDENVLTVSCDYAYFNDEAKDGEPSTKHTPILVSKVRGGAIFSDMVLEKGTHWYSVDRLVDHCLWLGEARLKLRSDGEPAVRALLEKVAEVLKTKGISVVPDLTPKGDSQAGGAQESGVQQFKNKARSLWHQACELHGVPAAPDHALLPWLTQYAGQLITRTHVYPDGRSGWSKVTGRHEFPKQFVPWGEKVHYIAGGGKFKPGIAPKWVEGIFVAMIDASNEYVVATVAGCVKTNNIKRMPKEDAMDPVLFNSVKGTPWKLTPGSAPGVRQEDIPIRMDIRPEVGVTLPPPLGRAAETVPRRVYIRAAVELVRYGFSADCRGCDAARTGDRPLGHTDDCRLRIERAIVAEEDPAIRDRLLETKRRRIEAVPVAPPAVAQQDIAVPMEAEGAGLDAPMAEAEPSRYWPSRSWPAEPSRSRPAAGVSVAAPAQQEMVQFFSTFELSLEPECQSFLELAEKMGGGNSPGLLFDIRSGCDLTLDRHLAMATTCLEDVKPYLLVTSTDCEAFRLMRTLAAGDGDHEKLRLRGMLHLRRVRDLCEKQRAAGRLFVNITDEKQGWGRAVHAELLQAEGVSEVRLSSCSEVQELATTNSPFVKVELECKHRSVNEALLRSLSKELRVAGRLMPMEAGGPTIDEAPPEDAWAERYYDEVTGVVLDPQLVKEGRRAEVDFMHKLKVYEEATMEECLGFGLRPIPMRWIDIDKGDDENPFVRCRAVLQETRKRNDLGPNDIAATFAGTPPLEGLRAMVSCSMTGQLKVPLKDRRVLGFYDVSRAHFHSPAKRRMYVRTLPEDTRIKTGIARLLKAMYGSRDAGQCWDDFTGQVMAKLGFAAGVISPCIYYNKEWDAPCWRHGDDFVLLATRAQHANFMKKANLHMILKCEGILGPCKDQGDMAEVRCLNRILRYVQPAFAGADTGYVEWEADPRHLQILMVQVGLKADSKTLGQPTTKMEKTADERKVSAADRAVYRSATMRLSYVAQDRIDVQFASKELARHMQEPTEWDLQQLKRCIRYMMGAGRVIQRFHQQASPERQVTCSDSDFAGCVRTRKSTSCCMVFWGLHLLRCTSTTQAIIALSSGEAEFYSAVKAASITLGMKGLMGDLGVVAAKAPLLRVDSTACLGMAGRKGAGRVRHIHTPCLWLQRAVAEGRLVLDKILGTENPSDLGTKSLASHAIKVIMQKCGYRVIGGSSRLALKASLQ